MLLLENAKSHVCLKETENYLANLHNFWKQHAKH